MKDTIYREDAIKAVAQDLMYESCVESEYASDELSDWIEVAKVMLEEVPSADRPSAVDLSSVYSTAYKSGYEKGKADRPQGEWIEQEDDYHHYWECSECGMGVGLDDIRNYCPNCGAKMDGEREGE